MTPGQSISLQKVFNFILENLRKKVTLKFEPKRHLGSSGILSLWFRRKDHDGYHIYYDWTAGQFGPGTDTMEYFVEAYGDQKWVLLSVEDI